MDLRSVMVTAMSGEKSSQAPAAAGASGSVRDNRSSSQHDDVGGIQKLASTCNNNGDNQTEKKQQLPPSLAFTAQAHPATLTAPVAQDSPNYLTYKKVNIQPLYTFITRFSQ